MIIKHLTGKVEQMADKLALELISLGLAEEAEPDEFYKADGPQIVKAEKPKK